MVVVDVRLGNGKWTMSKYRDRMTDTERVRAIVALCMQARAEGTKGLDWRLAWIEAFAFDMLSHPRDLYSQIPLSVTGHSVTWKNPELPDWVSDKYHE